MDEELKWFALRGHWVIRKVPNTKDKYYVACGQPPVKVLDAYGIVNDPLVNFNDQILHRWVEP